MYRFAGSHLTLGSEIAYARALDAAKSMTEQSSMGGYHGSGYNGYGNHNLSTCFGYGYYASPSYTSAPSSPVSQTSRGSLSPI